MVVNMRAGLMREPHLDRIFRYVLPYDDRKGARTRKESKLVFYAHEVTR